MSAANIGLFGFGTVGEGIYHALTVQPDLGCEVKKICIRDIQKSRNAPKKLFTDIPEELIYDPGIDIIIELIDDASKAYEFVKTSLREGKSVVSANKRMIAENLEELIQLQEEFGSSLLYEAAVCASIPIIRTLEDSFHNHEILSLQGIVNGSCNYILGQIARGNDYEQALGKAQEAGFAESDPSLDVEGFDSAYKLSILCVHAFGEIISPYRIDRRGITDLSAQDFQDASNRQRTVKLIAEASLLEGDLSATVGPKLINTDSHLASVHDEFNAISLKGQLCHEQFLCGKGAGRYPTTSAVLSDVLALKRGYHYNYQKLKRDQLQPILQS